MDATNGFPLITSRTLDDLPAFNRELLAALVNFIVSLPVAPRIHLQSFSFIIS